MQKKRICLVIPSLQAGGMERVMSELAGFFCRKDYLDVQLILYGKSSEIFYKLPEKIIIHKPETKFKNSFRLIYTIGRLRYLRKKIREINPDTVLSFGEYWNSFVLLALKGLSYPVYISDRCSPAKKFSAFHTYLRKRLYPGAKGIIAQTEKAAKIYKKQFGHKNIKIIGNPIHQINRGKENEKNNEVLMVGRLIKSKNQDKLIELFLDIPQSGWKLTLVGYDHLQQQNHERLMKIIKERKAEEKVFLEGKQSEVGKYYERSKIFAFTSTSEGFPNVIGEAMSAGLAVIAFDCIAGPSDMIRDNENGFLVPVNDYRKFRERLEMLMKNEDVRKSFGNKAAEDIKEFSINNIAEKYLQFILQSD